MSRLIINRDSAKSARRTRNRVRLAAVAVACAALFASATPAWAATNTITVGSVASLTAKIAISVPVTIVCDPLTVTGVNSTVSVQIRQANGKQISSASGQLQASPGIGNLLTCDGSTQNNVVVQAMPDQGSGPFRNGAAYVTASFTYDGGWFCGSSCSEGGSTAAAIKLH